MKIALLAAVFSVHALSAVRGDVYLHIPRGSNNRLNEQSAERTNANRVFDSQVRIIRSSVMTVVTGSPRKH